MTDAMFHWDPLFPVIPSVVAALVVLIIPIVLERRRKHKYLMLRVAAQCLLVVSILLITLRPSIALKEQTSSMLLITEGYNVSTVDSLKAANPSLDVRQLESFNDLPGMPVSLITGNGLPAWAIDLMPEKKFTFIPSPGADGISGVEIPGHVYAHRWNEIKGTYSLKDPSATLTLQGPGGVEDSITLKGPGDVAFSLSYFAKASGRFNYELVTPAGTENVPLVIEPERNFSILFIADYPTFEVRYLKNFLAAKGHRLSIRNQVSRGRYKLEFANRPPSGFQSLTTSVLKEADLLMIDGPSWHTLSAAEQRNLRAAIQDGLGVVILPDSKQDKRKQDLVQFTATTDKDTTRVSLNRAGSFLLPAVSLEANQSTPVLAANNRVLSGYRHSGEGKIGYQLLQETYQVGLKGKADAYSSLWVPLLEKCARSEKQDFRLKVTSPFPFYENQPISFDIFSSGAEPHLNTGNVPVPLTEDAYIDDLWHGKVWLEGTAWHELAIDSSSTWLHVAKSGSWKTLNGNNNRKATALRAKASTVTSDEHVTYDDRNVKVILFLIFSLASGFLWLAPKL